MEDLNKTEQVNVRMSPRQVEWLSEAAKLESERRGERVEPAALARDLIVAGVDAIRSRVQVSV